MRDIVIMECKKKHVKYIVDLLCKEIAKGHYATHEEIIDRISNMAFNVTNKTRSIEKMAIDDLLKNKKARIFVALVGNRLVGFSTGIVFNWWNNIKVGYSPDSVVQRNWRKHGVYMELIKARDSFYKKSNMNFS